jgi:hypothetical protein
MKPTLYVEEGALAIRLGWIKPANECSGKWQRTLWTHNEVTIAYKRCKAAKKMRYDAVANAIMCALQEANISLVSLRYRRNTPCRRKQKQSDRQLPLL